MVYRASMAALFQRIAVSSEDYFAKGNAAIAKTASNQSTDREMFRKFMLDIIGILLLTGLFAQQIQICQSS